METGRRQWLRSQKDNMGLSENSHEEVAEKQTKRKFSLGG